MAAGPSIGDDLGEEVCGGGGSCVTDDAGPSDACIEGAAVLNLDPSDLPGGAQSWDAERLGAGVGAGKSDTLTDVRSRGGVEDVEVVGELRLGGACQ